MTNKLTESAIRVYLMDRKELNPLLRSVRFSTEDINSAVEMTVSYYNSVPPFVDYQTSNSFPWTWLLLTGVSGHLLKSASINEASNELNYEASGVSIQDKNKASIFSQIGGQLWEEFKAKVLDIKMSINIGSCFSSSPSELAYLAR